MPVSKKVIDRITTQLKRYQAVLADAKNRDISESDTVVIIGDMLADAFGYKKYTEVTTEFAIRGTYVDLAVKVGEDTRFLLEAKAIGVALKDGHVKQAIDYAANHGIEWVILTNGIAWRVYKVHFRQPIDKSLVFDLDLLQANTRSPQVLECFGNLSREGFTKSSMTALFQQQQVTSKFSLAAILLSETIVGAVRREIRRLFPGIKVDEDFLRTVLQTEVLKREMVESDEAKQAVELLKKTARAAARAKARDADTQEPASVPADADPAPLTDGNAVAS
jgi:hypothetical protein